MLLYEDCLYYDRTNWVSNIRNLLNSLGFGDCWLAQNVGNATAFLSLVKQRLHDNFVQNWMSRLSETSRGEIYIKIASFELQPYLQIIAIKHFRGSLAR